MAQPNATRVPWQADQEFVDHVYARLDALRRRYRDRLADVRRQGASGTPQNRSERDAFATHYEETLARLEQVENRLVFGRLDLQDESRRYIGRIGIADDEQESLLIDWRAPAARPFYQATAAQRGEVVLRRHLMTRGRQVTGVEDELLDTAADVEGLTGEGALFAAMSAAREGRMNDIVATIQAEQDEIIRSDVDGVLVVEGGPGTGKTAVALHRAAYLLYTHRERLERSGVLVVGPSRVFLRYIEQVLPSLGESGVVATTLGDLLADVPVTGTEPEAVAALKGRPVMAQVLRSAVRGIPRRLAEPVVLDVDGEQVLLEPDDVRSAQERARRSGRPHNIARRTYATAVLEAVVRRWAEDKGLDLESEHGYLLQSVRDSRDARREINLRWMPTTPEQLLRRLYADPELLARHARGLTVQERRLLRRPADAPWTPADLPLLDELAVLLGHLENPQQERARVAREAEQAAAVAYAEHAIREDGLGGGLVDAQTLAARFAAPEASLSVAERAAADREWTYGHIVVDEAQELSPMAWRALLRRNPARSMTLVGDLDQRSGHTPARSWRELLGTAAHEHVRTAALTINYRTPAEVMRAAVRVLRAAGGAHAAPARSAREVPGSLRTTRLAGEADLVDVVAAEHAALGAGRVAVITAPGRVAATRAALADRLAGKLEAPGGDLLGAPVVVLDAVAAKGLEFDVVVLVEPAEIARGGPGDLYVAMTRPTRRLHVVHRAPLPEGFEA
ncbi:UvrD-helicase domain-containing protein [Georgenia sp. 311]|uniref:HelD family protein n=1 Tax=Georgenia sp. 311 TaxID=2585134 RepID=UPI00159BF090|nr:UvrD-helicase domain-containing protein [Georgenia sp. 311]